MTFVVTARWEVDPDGLSEVRAAVEELQRSSRAEPGCLLYQAHTDPEDPQVFFFYEQYDDEAAFQAHVDSAHFARLVRDVVLRWVTRRDRRTYVAIEDTHRRDMRGMQ